MAFSILIVEDDSNYRNLFREMLKIFGHTVIEAESGSKALEILDKSKDFDIIFSDISMSEMSGIEFTKNVRAKNILVPIIAVTGHSDSDTIQDCLKSGFNDYVIKPIKIKDITEIIARNVSNS